MDTSHASFSAHFTSWGDFGQQIWKDRTWNAGQQSCPRCQAELEPGKQTLLLPSATHRLCCACLRGPRQPPSPADVWGDWQEHNYPINFSLPSPSKVVLQKQETLELFNKNAVLWFSCKSGWGGRPRGKSRFPQRCKHQRVFWSQLHPQPSPGLLTWAPLVLVSHPWKGTVTFLTSSNEVLLPGELANHTAPCKHGVVSINAFVFDVRMVAVT